jgi:glucosylceramidase
VSASFHRRIISVFLLVVSSPLLAQTVHSYRSPDLSSALEVQPAETFTAKSTAAPITITVDEKNWYQTMDGFGISMMEGSAWLIHERLSPAISREVMTKVFHPSNGIGLSFVRLPIASTDLSINHYSYDDVPAGQQDMQLLRFSTAHDDAYVFPVMREALKLNPAITVMATPWSAPAWMKTNSSMIGGSLREDAIVFSRAGEGNEHLPLHREEGRPCSRFLTSLSRRIEDR